jgi:ADP-ribose pyrophosphatase YjhB (NUDIX family)
MEFGESPEACAVRELFEETGLRGEISRLFNVYTGADDPRTRAILIVFVARRVGGALIPGDDAIEADFFPLDALPSPIAFHSHRQALSDFRAELAGGTPPLARAPGAAGEEHSGRP